MNKGKQKQKQSRTVQDETFKREYNSHIITCTHAQAHGRVFQHAYIQTRGVRLPKLRRWGGKSRCAQKRSSPQQAPDQVDSQQWPVRTCALELVCISTVHWMHALRVSERQRDRENNVSPECTHLFRAIVASKESCIDRHNWPVCQSEQKTTMLRLLSSARLTRRPCTVRLRHNMFSSVVVRHRFRVRPCVIFTPAWHLSSTKWGWANERYPFEGLTTCCNERAEKKHPSFICKRQERIWREGT